MELRKDSLIELFKKYNAILEGHFLLSSGLHSDKYIQCALVLQYPHLAEKVAILLFEEIRNKVSFWQEVSLIVSPALGGIVIGQELARVIKTLTNNQIRAIFTERDDEGKMVLRRGFEILPEDKIIIVEDVVTTGKSTKEVIDVVKNFSSNILAVCSIFNRAKEINFSLPYFYIEKIEVNNYSKQECPLCAKGISLVKPGSRKVFK